MKASSVLLRKYSPLAPSLFILAEEVLSRGLSYHYAQGTIKPYQVPRGCPSISHLLFADDTILFTNGSKSSLASLMHFLSQYEAASGQLINKEKSCFLLAKKASPSRVAIVSATTGISRKNWPIQYLGTPLFTGAPKAAYFQALIEKIRK